MDVGSWLQSLGLGQYEAAFHENKIDGKVLPNLTADDLKELGVAIVGHRRTMLTAITEMAGSSTAPAPITKPPPTVAPLPAADAERRQVTVLFCDLVGSTALSATIDPEHLGALIRRYQDAAAGAIARFDGFLAKFMGDGILAYFGFPRAYEDAAERAVRAALGIRSEIGRIALPDGTPLSARIGIATGLVVVGEIIGTGASQERSIVGETPNLAARLQALAEPGATLISEATQNLIGGMFELELTGEHELKGFSRPVSAWRVLREALVESRFAAIRAGGNLPIIGRAHEMGLLLERWRLARLGEGQIVTVIGEAGIGKSRAVEALQEALVGEPHARIHLQCSPYHSDSALYPLTQHLGRSAHFAVADSPRDKIEKLSVLFVARTKSDAAAIPLLAELLSIPVVEPAALSSLTPARRKAATIALLVDEIVGLGETEPVLLIVEDAHWIDATTLELMTRLADSIGPARVLAVVTARPEFSAPWLARPHATLLTLGRLGRAECAQLVAGVAATHGLSAETVAAIVAKTDGVPLFVEELTKSVMESAGQDSAAVPTTLKDSLMARLDRLGEAREVAQIASVIGRQFVFALLHAVISGGGTDVEAALTRLVAAGIVFPEGGGAERSYSFKHALVRDAAYESLLLTRRRDWHERIARALEERFPEIAANEPELLAHHFGEAGLAGPACDYRMRAGDRAASRSAYKEAIAHFSAGLKSAEALPEREERMRHQLGFLVKLGAALTVVRGAQSAEVEDAYRRAAEIGEAIGDAPATYMAKWGLWYNANMRAKTALTRERASELVTLAQRSGDDELLLEAHHCGWSTALFDGDVAAMLGDGRIGAESYDIVRHRHLGPAFGGHDPGVCAHAVIGVGLEMSGDRERAEESLARALALGETLDHPASLAHALSTFSFVHQFGGDREATLAVVRRLAALVEKFGLFMYQPANPLLTAWANATGSGIADAARLIDAEIDKATAVGPLGRYFLGLAGEVLLAAGRPADGLAHLDRAIAMIDEPGVGLYLPEIYRLRGQCLLALDGANKAEARQTFVTARDVAKRQGAIIFERRAEAALAELGGTRSAG
jgi:class 3 adenylate cyclase/tetratricopeptide (TPR) repeat protein